nr:GTP cyclohydrolase I [Brevundimonas sp. AJA228-03]
MVVLKDIRFAFFCEHHMLQASPRPSPSARPPQCGVPAGRALRHAPDAAPASAGANGSAWAYFSAAPAQRPWAARASPQPLSGSAQRGPRWWASRKRVTARAVSLSPGRVRARR